MRALIAVPVSLALLGPVAPALAASSTSGYNQTVPVKKPPPSNGTGPSTSSSPSKSGAGTPRSSTAPSNTASSAPSSSSQLPFTGLDLRWIIGAGVLLIAGGLSLRMTQRKQGSGLGR